MSGDDLIAGEENVNASERASEAIASIGVH